MTPTPDLGVAQPVSSEARDALRTWLRDELASERGFITGSVDNIADKLLAAFPALTPAGPEERGEGLDLNAIETRMKAANEAVDDMCNGGRRWRMSVPADLTRDHDLVIGAALDDIVDLVAKLRETPR